ncbi:hypothetical protein AAG570_003953 [Ranatra chinensis]|uniref:Lipase domain-containing protein n=1 Tax=Ranatra chinensis TaxID=642074 RepID=A0ABD0Y2Q4_9HEMI
MAAEQTEPVGHYLGAFIEFLLGQGVRPEDVHLIGHSLGAHVAGFASASLGPIKLARISGLDPAKPCFHNSPPELRLDAGDALFVDCIHTCGGYLGLIEPICQADFYPNGGVDTQPGCLLITAGICSHGRSHDYYAESIKRGHRFSTVKCPGIPSEDISRCKRSINLMGYSASPRYVIK